MVKIKCKQCGKTRKVCQAIIKRGGGKFCSLKCYGKWQTLNRKSKNAANWKGGYKNYKFRDLCSSEYKLWRKSVFERDNFTCLICGEVGGYLNAHHIKNWVSYPELRYRVDNGMTMCEKCHKIVNKELPLFSIKINETEREISTKTMF